MDKEKLALNVLMVVSGFPTEENPSRSSFNLVASKLLSKRHKLTILRIRAWKPGRKFLEKTMFDNLPMLIIAFPLLNFKWLKSAALNQFFLGFILRIYVNKLRKFDIVHSVGGGLTAFASYTISKETKIPFIIQYIGSDVNFYLTKNYKKKSIKRILNAASYHGFNSKELLSAFTRFFPTVKNKVVIYRGITLETIKDKKKDLNNCNVLFLGGLTSGDYGKHVDNLKGGVNLLQAWGILDKKNDLSKVKLQFGGPNSSSYKKYMNLENLNHPNSFELIGEISRPEVERYMQESNIVIIPSLFEGLPNVAYEAMAYGNMVIGTKIGGIPEIVNKSCGILIEPDSIEAIVKALSLSIANLEFRINTMKGAKQRIKEFDSVNFLNAYSSIYNNLVK